MARTCRVVGFSVPPEIEAALDIVFKASGFETRRELFEDMLKTYIDFNMQDKDIRGFGLFMDLKHRKDELEAVISNYEADLGRIEDRYPFLVEAKKTIDEGAKIRASKKEE